MRSSRIPIAFVVLVYISGCSGGDLETVPVYGKIEFPGRERPKVCRIFFQPTETIIVARPTMVEAEEDGSYEVKAFQQSDGLIPGTYRVSVSYYDLKPGANPGLDSSWVEHNYDAGELVVDANSDGVEKNIDVPKKS